jgi:hypothetical protein
LSEAGEQRRALATDKVGYTYEEKDFDIDYTVQISYNED